jgi:hypothetical protein
MLRLSKPVVGLAAIISVASAAEASSITRSVEAHPRCHRVHGMTHSLFTAENCTSPIGLCTVGAVTHGGPLDGATLFLALNAAPGAGLAPVEPAANLSFSGVLTITGKHGTLVTHDLGVVDAVNGSFTELERPASGTGMFANPSNDFFISGIVSDNGNGFTGEISGTLCTDGDMGDDD